MCEFKKGELYKVRSSRLRKDFFAVYLIVEDSYDHLRVVVDSFDVVSDRYIYSSYSGNIDPFDEKITDPAEIAYWLLRFENARNNS